jgi:hypothetical protein
VAALGVLSFRDGLVGAAAASRGQKHQHNEQQAAEYVDVNASHAHDYELAKSAVFA